MRIAVLHPSYEGSKAPFKGFDPDCDPSPYLPEAHFTDFQIFKATATKQVAEIAAQGFDVLFNLCDGAWDEDRPGIEVVETLERLNVAFTGSGSAFYDPTREAMKMAACSCGVSVPAYMVVRSIEQVNRVLERVPFPMIVKHPQSYGSVGMTKDSRVTDLEGLHRQVELMLKEFGGALVEEFIEGREYTVLVTEPKEGEHTPLTYSPVEFVFPEGESFKYFNLKWVDHERMRMRIVEDEELGAKLRKASALTFEALAGSGYARCDLRVNPDGEVFLLEINPYGAVFYPEGEFGGGDFSLASEPSGHRRFLEHLLYCAKRRQERNKVGWELTFHPRTGFGMVATRDFALGEVVVCYEERACKLVSRQHVQKKWSGLKREWFEIYAYPITDNLFQLWADNPDEWRPINHSCDPNTWLEGLDIVARREIRVGDELTADYGTFYGTAMKTFDCTCGAVECRKEIRGDDYQKAELVSRYGDHVSDFVHLYRQKETTNSSLPFAVIQASKGGLLSLREWEKGETIWAVSWGTLLPAPTPQTIQVGEHEHAAPQLAHLHAIKHSCAPNVFFDIETSEIRAIRKISPGDELCSFYPSTEWQMSKAFNCTCGSTQCLGLIRGAASLSSELLHSFALSPVIRRHLAQNQQPK